MVTLAQAMSADQKPAIWKLCMLCFRVIGAVLGVAAALAFNLHEAIVVINPRWDVCLGLAVLLMPKGSLIRRGRTCEDDIMENHTTCSPRAHSGDSDRNAKAKTSDAEESKTDVAVDPEADESQQQLKSAQTDASTSDAGDAETATKTKKNSPNRLQKFFRGFRLKNRRVANKQPEAAPASPTDSDAQPANNIEALFERTWSSNA